MVVALYPGTFDPITNGHIDIAERASKIFDRIIVAVYADSPKRVVFTTEERIDLCKKGLSHLSNVEVIPFTGLVVEFAKQVGAQVTFRGLRSGTDFEFEFDMALMNSHLAPDMEAVYFITKLEWQFLSSSRLKEVVSLNGDISNFVPQEVEDALKAKLQGQVE
jgi:pantetheine-phosphate adenylyltransferase